MRARVDFDSSGDCCPLSDAGGLIQGADVAGVPNALYVVRGPMGVPCAKLAYQECMAREQARVRDDSVGDCPRSDAGGVVSAKPMPAEPAAGRVGALASAGIATAFPTPHQFPQLGAPPERPKMSGVCTSGVYFGKEVQVFLSGVSD